MCRLASGLVLAVIVVASLGCGGGLSEKEVREIVVETTAAIQADYRAEINRGDDATHEAVKRMLQEDRAVREEEATDFLKRLDSLYEEANQELRETVVETIQTADVENFQLHVDAICMLDYKVVTLSVALEALILYLAGGNLTLEEIADVFIEGVPIDGWDFSWQHNRLCGISAEGRLYLLPIPEIDE